MHLRTLTVLSRCLAELGYTPGLLEKVRYLEDVCPRSLLYVLRQLMAHFQNLGKSKATNEQLLRDKENHALRVEELEKKVTLYQSENVKLFEDNVKLVKDCELLRKELSILRAQAVVNQEMHGKPFSEILAQYALLKDQYADAVKVIQLRGVKPNAMDAQAATTITPQPQPLAYHPPRQLQPTPSTSECLFYSASGLRLTRRCQVVPSRSVPPPCIAQNSR